MTVSAPKIAGFLQEPKQTAQKEIYRGRFACPDVQWTESGNQIFCTFTVTAAQVADAAASGLLWTDQDVQRGIQPGIIPKPSRELSLATGHPDTKCYVFDFQQCRFDGRKTASWRNSILESTCLEHATGRL